MSCCWVCARVRCGGTRWTLAWRAPSPVGPPGPACGSVSVAVVTGGAAGTHTRCHKRRQNSTPFCHFMRRLHKIQSDACIYNISVILASSARARARVLPGWRRRSWQEYGCLHITRHTCTHIAPSTIIIWRRHGRGAQAAATWPSQSSSSTVQWTQTWRDTVVAARQDEERPLSPHAHHRSLDAAGLDDARPR
jgi:hypothetical protein